jgi:hypothetical protein
VKISITNGGNNFGIEILFLFQPKIQPNSARQQRLHRDIFYNGISMHAADGVIRPLNLMDQFLPLIPTTG